MEQREGPARGRHIGQQEEEEEEEEEEYGELLRELGVVEGTIDRLETFSLGKWSSGNFYLTDPGCSIPHKGTKTGKPTAFCKLFSLSSCSSQASSLLREPKQSVGL